jgi:16S rRNA (cytidine1402-2'-O)-methyltransferase
LTGRIGGTTMTTSDPTSAQGTLTLVSTPIGNLGDITLRALDVLRNADVVLAEDTRHSGKLLAHHGVRAKVLLSYHDHNKERVTPGIVERLRSGQNVALVSDAGTPGLSDPGFYLVRASLEAGLRVTTTPGANAVLPALVMSGFPTDAFVFEGFPPRKKSELARAADAIAEEKRTVVYFVSPHRIHKMLGVFAERLPDRTLAIVREITKLHEEVIRGTAAELLESIGDRKVRGEIVLLVKGVGRRNKSARGAT